MKRLLSLFLVLFVVVLPVAAQHERSSRPRHVSSLPGLPCSERDFVQLVDSPYTTSLCKNGAWEPVTTGAAGMVAGSDTQVQFNDGGVFGADAGLVYNKTTDALGVNGTLAVGQTVAGAQVDVLTPAATIGLNVGGTPRSSTGAGSGAASASIVQIVGTVGQATSSTTASTSGGQGGSIDLVGGIGGAKTGVSSGGASNAAGQGGGANLTGGAGGNMTALTGTGKGGRGGQVSLQGGAGGTGASGDVGAAGGAGGSVVLNGGAGGIESAARTSGAGGSISVLAGDGAGNTAGGNGGSGGSATVDAGAGGVASGGGVTGTAGTVTVGTTNASAVTVGHSTVPLSLAGSTITGTASTESVTIDGSAHTVNLAAAALASITANSVPIVTTTSSQELTNKTLTSSVGKGTWTASGTWTLPAFTLGGTVSAGAQTLTNVGLEDIGFGGTAPPSGPTLAVASTVSTSPRGILSAQFSTDTSGARVGFQKARGSIASPTTVVTGDTLGRLMFRGYDGSNYQEMGSIEVAANGTIAATRVPTQMIFSTATNAAPSVLTTALTIGNDQSVTHAATTVLTGLTTQSVGATTSAATDWLINPTTKASGNLLDAQVNSVSKFSVDSTGAITGLSFKQSAAGANVIDTAGNIIAPTTKGVYIPSNGFLSLSGTSVDTTISRNAAGATQFGTTAANALGTILFTGLTASSATQTWSNAAFTTCTALTTVANVMGCTASDRKLKQNFQPFTNGLKFIRSVQPQIYSFKAGTPWHDHDRPRLGLVAQDVQKTLPLAVFPIGPGQPLQIDYNAVIAAQLDAIKQLDAKITVLERQVNTLRKAIHHKAASRR